MQDNQSRCELLPGLTRQESALYRVLLDNRGHTVPRGRLLQQAWGMPADAQTRTVDVHIQHLRKKLRRSGAGMSIETVFRVGYRLAG